MVYYYEWKDMSHVNNVINDPESTEEQHVIIDPRVTEDQHVIDIHELQRNNKSLMIH